LGKQATHQPALHPIEKGLIQMRTIHRHPLPSGSRTASANIAGRAARTLASRWRRAVTVLIALACVLVATACVPGAQPGSSSDGKTTLRISTWGNDSRIKLTQGAVDAFMKANPDIKVSVENSEWGAYWDKLATTTAANDSPDVIQMDESYIAAYGSRNALLDLDTAKSNLDLSAMDAKVLDTGKVGGKLVGAPIGTANFSVAVNPKVLQQAGVPMPNDKTWTWDDLAQASAQVTAKLGSKGVYGFDGFGLGAAELGAWTRQRGEEVWPTQGQTPVSAATITSFFDYANKLIQLKATPVASSQVENTNAALDSSLFATNKAAFHLLFHTQVSAFGTASGTEMKLLRLPAQQSGQPKMVNKASMYWSIAARSKHVDAAAKLVDFLMTDPAATKILLTERGIPAIPAVQKDVAPLLDPQSKVALKFSQAIAPELVPPPQVTPAAASGFSGEFTNIGTEVLFGRSSSADGATKTLSVMQGMK
jgi:multiple sugar transport system substrate-binding protein